jgi:hypothetical protein
LRLTDVWQQDPDIAGLEPRVRHVSFVDFSEGIFSYYKALDTISMDEKRRLLEASKDKMKSAWSSNSDDSVTLADVCVSVECFD